jgi:pimeloyl-ACP methyl ester carboxylesterase
MAFADVGDVRLFFTDDGDGDRPILFVHGFSCDSHDWTWQFPHFVDGHRVIAVDLRGHGRSSVPDQGYEPRQFAADIAAGHRPGDRGRPLTRRRHREHAGH